MHTKKGHDLRTNFSIFVMNQGAVVPYTEHSPSLKAPPYVFMFSPCFPSQSTWYAKKQALVLAGDWGPH